eukprot:m.418828 g.418828  ORF g.418828 m.418828 type:complete len:457 (+) comp31131_c0_seq1:233-1603(+)
MEKYAVQGKIGEGTFSTVFKCTVLEAGHPMEGQAASVKKMKKKYPSIDHVNSLREVQALKRLNPHPNILQLIEVVYTEEVQSLDLVCELLTENLYEKIKDRKQPLPTSLVKSYTYQLLKALEHMHRNGIFHRDVKPENILLDSTTDTLKLADFGSCRGIYSKVPFTEYISTRWYRAPECLLTDGYYGFKMDTWSVGCVFFEVATLRPLFPGTNEVDQLDKIHNILGVPDKGVLNKIRKNSMHMSFKFRDTPGCGLAKCLPQASAHFLDVLAGLLEYDPDERMSARQAIRHPYFADQRQLDSTRRAQPPPGVVEPPPEAKKKTASLKRVDPSPLPAREQRKNGKVLPAVSSKPQPVRNPQQVRRGPKRPPRIVHHPLLHPNNAVPERKWQAAAPRVSGTHKTNKGQQQPGAYTHSYMVRSKARIPAKPSPVLPPLVLKQVKPQANPAKFYAKKGGRR